MKWLIYVICLLWIDAGEFPMDCPLQDSLLCIHYKGMLPDEGGKVFYDTRVDGNGQPLEFESGEGMVRFLVCDTNYMIIVVQQLRKEIATPR